MNNDTMVSINIHNSSRDHISVAVGYHVLVVAVLLPSNLDIKAVKAGHIIFSMFNNY